MSDDWWDRVSDRSEDRDVGGGRRGDGSACEEGQAHQGPAPRDWAGPVFNEVVFELRGQTRVGRMSYEAAAEIESRLGIGLNAVAGRIIDRDIRFTDLAAVIAATTRDPRRPVPYEEICEAVIDTGMTRLAGPAIRLLEAAIAGTDPHPPRGPAKIIDLAKYRAAKEPKDSS